MQNSKANIWEKIKHFFYIYLPTKEQLFKKFLKERRWLKYREELVKDILGKSNIQSNTTIHDVPYSIRTKEGVKLNRK
jgi:CRISPR/Cas system endoribonuclease Cas6 (RAMP superfamily)